MELENVSFKLKQKLPHMLVSGMDKPGKFFGMDTPVKIADTVVSGWKFEG